MRGDKYNHYPPIFSLNPHTFHVQAEVRLRRKGVAGRGLVSGSRQDAEAAGDMRPKGGWRQSRNLDGQPHPLPYIRNACLHFGFPAEALQQIKDDPEVT